MASADQLKALLKSHITGDDSHFFSVAMQVAAHEAKLGHGKLAEELKALIDAAKARPSSKVPNKTIPISQPRGELVGLLQASYPQARLSDMILDDQVAMRLHRIIKEQQNHTKIRAHGLSPRRKLLLVGPPGTGKTLTASALAGELGVPLFVVRLDALITKFMGETAAKLRQVFDAITEVRGVYFFDEFDAIGSQRGQANDVGEIRRVLNSFLQMLEQDQSHSLIIAATNHPEILDYALFRRFDDMIQYGLPEAAQIIAVLKNRLSTFKPKRLAWSKLADKAIGLSYADVARAADDTLKDAIIHDRVSITDADIFKMLEERKLISKKILIDK
ncbi:AAA family ATPase [Pseudomonas agarici]|uniref:AAA family ATPase n=1 Tax=Pseudomonas agarici TaxID=46677 RepID=UPI0002F4AF62|nr:ATP-binding protein [Pseudomonas agarici]NWB90270.1 ATP-binding protein [Pseudomonas agarici]NWC08811.1 ATP-binding protein [Pseudomonas agarici]SEK58466.1 ATPase family associated with various cellular activities (AAA) [Pseudomonas agarici]